MDPINVDFGASKPKVAQETPEGSTLKKVLIALGIDVVVGAILYYVTLPALNFKATELYTFIAILVAVFIVSFLLLSKAFARPQYMEYTKKKLKIPVIILIVLALAVVVGKVSSSVIFRAKSYHNIIDVKEGNFAEEVAEIDFQSVPRLDRDSSDMIATRALGELSDYVSQFVVNYEYSTQINYKSTPVRVQTLDYGDVFKWLKNTKNGIPAYIIVDMTTQKAETVRLDSPIKYTPAEHFNRYLMRHVRFKYPTLMFDKPSFEIDDKGNPYWIVPVLDKTIGLFGGTDVMGAVIVDACSGKTELVSTTLEGKEKLHTDKSFHDDEYKWVDVVYSAKILNQQYNFYGKFGNGFINSIMGQSDVKVTSQGYNYLALNDDVYMYTGVTSISSDQSIIGFVLINQRTKEAKYYQVSGVLEYTAQTSAQGKVQEKGYQATFPLLLNVSGEPTYFMSLKDASQLVKMYAMVNVKQSTVVAVGSSLTECTENYAEELKKNGINVNIDVDALGSDSEKNPDAPPAESTMEITDTIKEIRSLITSGQTYFYVKLNEGDSFYLIPKEYAEKVLIANVGDQITFVVEKEAKGNIIDVISVK